MILKASNKQPTGTVIVFKTIQMKALKALIALIFSMIWNQGKKLSTFFEAVNFKALQSFFYIPIQVE